MVWEVVPRLAWPVGANARTAWLGGFSVVRLRWRVGGFEGVEIMGAVGMAYSEEGLEVS